jgi:hypothetical protein
MISGQVAVVGICLAGVGAMIKDDTDKHLLH